MSHFDFVNEPDPQSQPARENGSRRPFRDSDDRDFDRPRRKKKPFPLVKVLLAVSAVLLILCGGGGLAIFSLLGGFGPSWKNYEPAGAGVSVEMPYRATMTLGPSDRNYTGVTVHESFRIAPHQEFSLFYAQNGMTPDSLLAFLKSGVQVETPTVRETSRTPVTNSQGFSGVEVVWDMGQGETWVFRAISDGTATYAAAALGKGFTPQTPEVRRYLDSLKVTKPGVKPPR